MDNKDKDYTIENGTNAKAILEYCFEQGIPVGPPFPNQEYFTYSINIEHLSEEQYKHIESLTGAIVKHHGK